MKPFWLLVMILLSLTTSSTAVPKYAMPRCKEMCGKVRIPYPFGIGANCSVNEWYDVDCNSSTSTPYLSKFDSVEVLDINLDNQTVTVNVSMISDCVNPVWNSSQISNIDLDGSPFLFSRLHNKFVVEVCGNAVLLDHESSVVTGCSSMCRNDSILREIEISKCLGISCCQTTIPYNLKSFSMNLASLERQLVGGDGVCGWAFLVDENSHVRSLAGNNISYVPISLLWTLTQRDSSLITCCLYADQVGVAVDVGNGNSVASYKCRNLDSAYYYNHYQGNPYMRDGCDVTDECQRCIHGRGRCAYNDALYLNEDGNTVSSKGNMTCYPYSTSSYGNYERKISMGAILGPTLYICKRNSRKSQERPEKLEKKY